MSKLLIVGEAGDGPVNTVTSVFTDNIEKSLKLFGHKEYKQITISPQGGSVTIGRPVGSSSVVFYNSVNSLHYDIFVSSISSGSIVLPAVPLTGSQVGWLEYVPQYGQSSLTSAIIQAYSQSFLTPIPSFDVLRLAPNILTQSQLALNQLTFKYIYPSIAGNNVTVLISATDLTIFEAPNIETKYTYSSYKNLGDFLDSVDLNIQLTNTNVSVKAPDIERYQDVYSVFSAVTGTYILTGSISSSSPVTGYLSSLYDLDLEEYDIIAFPGTYGRQIFPLMSYIMSEDFPTLFVTGVSGTTLTSVVQDVYKHRNFVAVYGTGQVQGYDSFTSDLITISSVAMASDKNFYSFGSYLPLNVTTLTAVTNDSILAGYGVSCATYKNRVYSLGKMLSTDLTAKPYVTSIIKKFFKDVKNNMIDVVGKSTGIAVMYAETALQRALEASVGPLSPVITYEGQVVGSNSELTVSAHFTAVGTVDKISVSTTVPLKLTSTS